MLNYGPGPEQPGNCVPGAPGPATRVRVLIVIMRMVAGTISGQFDPAALSLDQVRGVLRDGPAAP